MRGLYFRSSFRLMVYYLVEVSVRPRADRRPFRDLSADSSNSTTLFCSALYDKAPIVSCCEGSLDLWCR